MENDRIDLPPLAGIRSLVDSRRALVLGGVLSIVILALALTFFLARPRYLMTKAAIASGLSEIENARVSWSLRNTEPLDVADPVAMEKHARVLRVWGRDIEKELLRLRDGEGMLFWFFWCRGREADAFQASLAQERGVALAAEAALAAVGPLRTEVAGWLSDSAEARSRAVAKLVPASDEVDLASSVKELRFKLADLSGKRPRIGRARATRYLAGLPERYRLAILTDFERQLDSEMARVKARITAALRAASLLREHKAAMSDALEGSGDVILALETLATNLLPLAEVTFQATHPVHEAIGFLKQPVTSGNPIGNLMDSFLPSAVRVELTPFAILSQLNPKLGEQIETVETVCEVIEVFRGETANVAATILPFAGSLREFEATQSRNDMYLVLDNLPGAVDSLNSLAARTESALGELARARSVAAEVRRVSQMARQGYVRDLAEATASAADGLVELASEPFVDLKDRLQGTAANLISLKAQEERYQRQLAVLQSQDEIDDETTGDDVSAVSPASEIPECKPADRVIEVIPAKHINVADIPGKVRTAAEQAGRHYEGSGTSNTQVKILEAFQLDAGVEDEFKPIYALTLRITAGSLGESEELVRKGLYSAWSENTFPYLRDGEIAATPTGEYERGTPTLFPFWWEDEWENASFAMEHKPYFVDEEGLRRDLYVFPGEVKDGPAVEFVKGYADIYVPSCRLLHAKVKTAAK